MKFNSRRSIPLFGLSADPRPIPYAGGQPKRSVALTAFEFPKRAGIVLTGLSGFMQNRRP